MRPQDRPAQPRPVDQRHVHRVDIRDAVGNDMHRLAPQGRRQTVGNMPYRVFFQSHGGGAETAVECFGPVDHFRVRAIELNQRHQMRRIERVGGDQTVGGAHPRYKVRPRVRRGAGGDDHIARHRRFDLGIKPVFQRYVFGRVFLNQDRASKSVL